MTSSRTDAWMRIGELARQLGTTTRTLRYWEQRSLIPAALRTPAGYRLYGVRHLEAARGIGRLKQAGLGLEQIRNLQSCVGSQPTALAGLNRMGARLELQIRQVQSAIKEQQQLLAELVCSRELLHACNGCGGKPYDHECVRCLDNVSEEPMPDTLVSILASSAESSNRRSAP